MMWAVTSEGYFRSLELNTPVPILVISVKFLDWTENVS
jgi:hypothetical protein